MKVTPSMFNSSAVDTVKVQKFLGVDADGLWGPQTEAAFRKWQEKNDFSGPLTQEMYDAMMQQAEGN